MTTQDCQGTALRHEVQELAEEAFNKRLISGYGDGQYDDEYQISIAGKPRHFRLEYAHSFLKVLLDRFGKNQKSHASLQSFPQWN